MSKDDRIRPEDVMNFDEEGNLVYSRDLFLVLTSGEVDNIILEYPDLLKLVWEGVSDLFKTYEKFDIALELCSMSFLKHAIIAKFQEIHGIDISNLTIDDMNRLTPAFKKHI